VRAIQDDYASTMRHQRAGLNAGRSFAFDDIIAPSDTRTRILAMLRLTPRSRRAEKAHYIDSI
jgi:acetyl-CoA carboxylase carboxyltransferase component